MPGRPGAAHTEAMTSPHPDWPEIKRLFEAALALPPDERSPFLQASGASAALQAEVLSLLAHSTGGGSDAPGFLAQPAVAAAPADQRLGAWLLVEPLGSGGMGEVWRVRRADGAYEGEAALKLLKRGMDSAAVLARFAQERQALARLDHPHIARLFDAGLSPAGLPYFVMELVQGQSIDKACQGLTLEQRLALFLQLCSAVAYAHRQLLVHRDLKPSNVLVNEAGQVKLLDFGIAKALDPLEGAEPEHTAQGQRPYTPHYASPEQVRGEPMGTGTDIYSLGVLLYVMLTGSRPYGRGASTPAEAARSVLEDAPTRPSTLPPGQNSDPQWPQTRKRLQGDLDNILLKTLSKEAEQRYASVDALAEDVRAHLQGYPVSAQPQTLRYLAGRWIARNRLATGAGALGLGGLLLGLGLSLWQGHQAAQARDETRAQLGAVKDIMNELVFDFGDTVTTLSGGPKAQEAMLKRSLAALEAVAQRSPADRDLQALLASALGRLAELQGNQTLAAPERAAEAQATIARALTLAEPLWPAQAADWRFSSWHARTLTLDAQQWRLKGDPQQGVQRVQLAVQRCDEALRSPQPTLGRAQLLATRAGAYLLMAQLHDQVTVASLNQPQEALRLYARTEADLRALLEDRAMLAELDRNPLPGDPATAVSLTHQIGTVLGGRALVYLRLEDLPAMRREAAVAVQMRRANVAQEPRNLAWRDGLMVESNTLAIALIRLGEAAPALEAAQTSWDTAQALAAEAGPQSKWAGVGPLLAPQYGRALALNGRHAQAIAVFDQGIALWSAQLNSGPNPNAQRRKAWLEVHRSRSMQALGQTPAATALAEQALAALRPLSSHAQLGRDADLARAEGALLLATMRPAQTQALRAEARQALQDAAARRPLGADYAALLAAL